MTYSAFMRDGEIFVVSLSLVLGAGLVALAIAAVFRSRSRKLRVLEQALQSGSLDPETRHLLVVELTKPGWLGRLWSGGRLLVAAGWIGVFAGIGMLLSGERDAERAGPFFALMSFGVLTVPFALRELEQKRQAASRRT